MRNLRKCLATIAITAVLLAGCGQPLHSRALSTTITGNIPTVSQQASSEAEKEIAALDTSELRMNVGDYYVFRAEFFESGQEWTPVEDSLLRCEVLPSAEDGTAYVRITALAPGQAVAGVENSEGRSTFPVEIVGSSVQMDTREEVFLETGESYGFIVSGQSGEVPQVSADGMQVKEIAKENLADGEKYYEITALKAGSFRVVAEGNGDTVAFPVTASASSAEAKAAEYASATDLLILTDIGRQKVMVFQGSQNNWEMIQAYPCSSGAEGTETPLGEFQVQVRGEWFFNSRLGEGAQWYVGFWGDYLFHSYPMDRNQKVLDYRLGVPLSHGCVRLRIEDAKWLYDNVPIGTKVVIY